MNSLVFLMLKVKNTSQCNYPNLLSLYNTYPLYFSCITYITMLIHSLLYLKNKDDWIFWKSWWNFHSCVIHDFSEEKHSLAFSLDLSYTAWLCHSLTQSSIWKHNIGPEVVAHVFNPIYLGDRDQKDFASSSSRGRKELGTHMSTNKSDVVGTLLQSQLHGKHRSKASSRQKYEILPKKITKVKKKGLGCRTTG
jgi:hypothetical protein